MELSPSKHCRMGSRSPPAGISRRTQAPLFSTRCGKRCAIRSVIGATTINPQLLTSAEKLQYEGYVRREETNAVILALAGPKDRTNDDIGSRSSE